MGAQPRDARDIQKQFADAGFEIVEAAGDGRGALNVRKNNCLRHLTKNSNGAWILSGPAYFQVRGMDCVLEDRGYQKFWLADGKRFPIRVADLKTFHHFDEEVRELLGVKSLYHESLGSTCERTVYDRLTGRPDK